MKKVLALVLAAVLALSLTTAVSAFTITPTGSSTTTAAGASELNYQTYTFGDDAKTVKFPITGGSSYTTIGDSETFATKAAGVDYTLSTSVTSSDSAVLAASIETKDVTNGKQYTLVLNPADEYFTVETKEVKVKFVVVQKASTSGSTAVSSTNEVTIKVANTENGKDLFFTDATGKVTSVANLTAPVVPAAVFTDVAKGKALELKYADYAINFAKVTNQNTGLYLKAKTGVVAAPTKAIASIAFQPTRVKDAATVTMPISADNENLYGEKVFVYALVDNKPSGEAIEGTVVNHNSVIFTVPAGTALGTYAAYGDKALGNAEKPAIPETGANDIVNIAIVFAVVALAAAGFVAVKKASK